MFKVLVDTDEVIVKSGTLDNGNPWETFSQSVWVTLPGKKFPVELLMRIKDVSSAYAPGNYRFADDTFETNGAFIQSKKLPTLVPLTPAKN